MRDIRPDLRERIEARRADRDRILEQLEAYDASIEALEALLASEEARMMTENAKVDIRIVPAMPLDDFLVQAISRGVRAKGELRDSAIRAGYFQDTKQNPGRVVHAKLLHLVKDGKVRLNGKREYLSGADKETAGTPGFPLERRPIS